MRFLLETFYDLVHSDGLAIIMMSIVVNIFILPLYYLAENYKNQDQKIRGKMSGKIAYFKKYFQGRERHFYLQTLYKQHHYSQLSSVKASMGLLLQIPFFFAAFHLLGNYPAFDNISFWIIDDLNQPDNLFFGLNLLPILMTLINLFAAYFYVKNMSKSERYQLWGLAVIFLVLLYFEPAALLIYWTANNLFSLLKNIIHSKFNANKYQFSTSFSLKNSAITIYSYNIYHKLKPSKIKFLLLFVVWFVATNIAINNLNSLLGNVCLITAIVIFCIVTLALLLGYLADNNKKNTLFAGVLSLVVIAILIQIVFIAFGGFGFYGKTISIISAILFLMLGARYILGKLKFLTATKPCFKLFIIALITLSLLILVVNPIILYNSTNDFTISSQFLLKNLLLVFSLTIIGLSVFYQLSNITIQNILLFGTVFFLVISTIYSFMIVKNYGLMDHFIFHNPELLQTTSLATTIELLLLALLFVATIYLIKNYRLILMQVIAGYGVLLLMFFIINAPDSIKKIDVIKSKIKFDLEYEKSHTMAMSKEKNILVFFLDGFSGDVINQILKNNSEILNPYQGFVWYKNTLTTSDDTMTSVAAMFGGEHYTVNAINKRAEIPLQQELNHAYNIFPKYFIPEGWDISYFDPQYANKIDPAVHQIRENYYQNYFLNQHNLKIMSNLKAGVEISMLRIISLFKALPLSMKNGLYSGGSWSQIFGVAKASNDTALKTASVWGFLNSFHDFLNFTNQNKTLKFFQLQTPHYPYGIAADGTINPNKSSYYTEAYKSIEKIGEIIKKLQKSGVYNQTKLIVTSDHGWEQNVTSDDFENLFNSKILFSNGKAVNWGRVQALLMVKDFNATGDLKTSNRFMSNQDVAIIVCSVLKNQCNLSDKNPIKNNLTRTLLTSAAEGSNSNTPNKFTMEYLYEVKHNIFDSDNWQLVE